MPIPPIADAHQDLVVAGQRLEVRTMASPDRTTPRAPLVFLHEGLGSVSTWTWREGEQPIDWPAELCAATGRAGVVYSRRGYGQSEAIPDVRGAGRHPPDYMAREARTALPALLAALKIERPVLIGHSDGGTIALLHASTHPVTACVVMAPHLFVERISTDAIAEAKLTFETGELRQRLAKHHADVDSAFWQWNDVWLSEAFAPMNIEADVARITAPILAIQGEGDPYGTMAQIDAIARAAPQTRLLKLPRCGHAPQRDQRARVTAAIHDFLAGV